MMEDVKSCCATLYESDFARILLGDSFHPGGLRLTERLGELLGLKAGIRVLDVASGKVGLSDLTRSTILPRELNGLLAWIACIADAQPVEEYSAYLTGAGFAGMRVEIRDEALAQMVRDIQGKLLGAELMSKLKKIDLEGVDFAQAKQLARAASEAVREKRLGYALIYGQR